MFLKQHRKATLELDGRKLKGNFEVSLTNSGDRETITEFINEMRKQLREFAPSKAKNKPRMKNAAIKQGRSNAAKKKTAKRKRKAA